MVSTIEHPPQKNAAARILLLQGPVGPFFESLHKTFIASGFEVKRVLYNSADKLFAFKQGIVRFSGDEQDWESWLRTEFKCNKPDIVVFFGSSRPAHKIARKLAPEFGIETVSLEEGYLRSGYITCEIGGNNQHSPLCDWNLSDQSHGKPLPPLDIRSSFLMMCLWAAIYYLWRGIFKLPNDTCLYHRQTNSLLKEAFAWTTNTVRRFFAKQSEASTINQLCTRLSGKYLLIPLQTPSDSQLKMAARGWNNKKLVEQSLLALKKNKSNQLLVFKTHPLDTQVPVIERFINRLAQQHHCARQVIILHSGSISELTKHSSGMVVINSTSGFSALHHNVPLLVLGEAVYRHASIATIGDSAHAISEFFKLRSAKDQKTVKKFIETVKACALLPGDFYILQGRQLAAQAITKKIATVIQRNPLVAEQRNKSSVET